MQITRVGVDIVSTPTENCPPLWGKNTEVKLPPCILFGLLDGGLVNVSCARFSLVLEPVAFAIDLHDMRVMQQPIQHGRRQCLIIGKCRSPAGKWQV